jgi:hypothetical protein
MSTLTVAEARDEILTLFKTAWGTNAPTVPVFYDDLDETPPESGAWVKVYVNLITARQASLAGSGGVRRWERFGQLYVQIFTESGLGLSLSDQLVTIVLNALEGATTPGGVWFRNVRPNEIGRDGKWWQVNVTADFVYDQIK